jgi:hypothetical protein
VETWDEGASFEEGFDEGYDGGFTDDADFVEPGRARVDRSDEEWGTMTPSAQPQPSAPAGTYYDEPTFGDDTIDEDTIDEDAEPLAPDREGDDTGWRSSLATSSAMDFQLPSLAREDDESELEDDFEDEIGEDTAVSPTLSEEAVPLAEATPVARPPLCLLIPTPVTNLDDLAALVRFVGATQSMMVRSVAEVPAQSHVLLIGTTGTEEWAEVEQQLASRGLTYERVTRKLAEAFADDSLFGL